MNGKLMTGALLSVFTTAVIAQTTVEITSTRDTSIFQGIDGNSNGAGPTMVAGRTARGALRRTLFAFDDLSAIPAGATILDATLRMEVLRAQAGSDRSMAIHQVTASWGEAGSTPAGGAGQGGEAQNGDATWTHREFDQLLWETPGGEFNATPAATSLVGAEGFYDWGGQGLIDAVSSWTSGASENHGFALVGDESANRSTKHFSTREGLTPPALVVTFSTEGTAEPLSINQGLAGSWFDPVTPGQGFLIDVDPDLSLIFLAWFTFDTASTTSTGAKVGSADQRWLTAQGFYAGEDADVGEDGSILLTITNTTGGVFDDPTPVAPAETVGSILLRFDSCASGEISYVLDTDDLEGTIPIQRLLPGTAALCETLAELR